MKSLLVPVANRPECALALEAAFGIAKRLGADVTGCHMRPNKQEKAVIGLEKEDFSSLFSRAPNWADLTTGDAEAESVEAQALFERLADEKGYPVKKRPGSGDKRHALWRESLGAPQRLMPIIGPMHDMLVVSRPKAGGGMKASLMMMQAILNSQRPVLLLPQVKTKVSGRKVAVAWNGGTFEARTLLAVLPLLVAADDVVFLTAGKQAKPGPKAQDMVKYLKHHGVVARTAKIRAGKAVGQNLIDAAEAEGADILVAGAYSKGRLFETVFGGVSEYLIRKTDFPVLLMHH